MILIGPHNENHNLCCYFYTTFNWCFANVKKKNLLSLPWLFISHMSLYLCIKMLLHILQMLTYEFVLLKMYYSCHTFHILSTFDFKLSPNFHIFSQTAVVTMLISLFPLCFETTSMSVRSWFLISSFISATASSTSPIWCGRVGYLYHSACRQEWIHLRVLRWGKPQKLLLDSRQL